MHIESSQVLRAKDYYGGILLEEIADAFGATIEETKTLPPDVCLSCGDPVKTPHLNRPSADKIYCSYLCAHSEGQNEYTWTSPSAESIKRG